MKVKELRQFLETRGVATGTFLEKQDFLDRALRLL